MVRAVFVASIIAAVNASESQLPCVCKDGDAGCQQGPICELTAKLAALATQAELPVDWSRDCPMCFELAKLATEQDADWHRDCPMCMKLKAALVATEDADWHRDCPMCVELKAKLAAMKTPAEAPVDWSRDCPMCLELAQLASEQDADWHRDCPACLELKEALAVAEENATKDDSLEENDDSAELMSSAKDLSPRRRCSSMRCPPGLKGSQSDQHEEEEAQDDSLDADDEDSLETLSDEEDELPELMSNARDLSPRRRCSAMRCPPGLQQHTETDPDEHDEDDEEDSMEMPTPSPKIKAEDIISRRRRCSTMRCPPGLHEEPSHNEWDEPTGFNDAIPANPYGEAVDHGLHAEQPTHNEWDEPTGFNDAVPKSPYEDAAEDPTKSTSDRSTDTVIV